MSRGSDIRCGEGVLYAIAAVVLILGTAIYGLITGEIWSWGDDDGSSAEEIRAVPVLVSSQNFATVSTGDNNTCGVRADGSVECWGNVPIRSALDGRLRDQARPPSGEFASVSVRGFHTCGVRTDGSVECWGHNNAGQATPPPGEFVSVTAGTAHTCGVRRDGSVECWGSGSDGRATPPPGEFVSVTAGSGHTCGLRQDGSVECWGRDDYGQATPPRRGVRLRQRRDVPHLRSEDRRLGGMLGQ